MPFNYGAFTLFGGLFQILRLDMNFVTPWRSTGLARNAPQPSVCNALQLGTYPV